MLLGSCCCPPTDPPGDLCFTVIGCCGARIEGATITVYDGSMVEVCSGDTDEDGLFCCESLAFGTYTYDVEADGYGSISGASVVHATAPTSKTVFLTTTAVTGCGPCDSPLPESLTLTFFGGTVALTYSATEGFWYGCTDVPIRGPRPDGTYPAWARNLCDAVTGPYAVTTPIGCVFNQYTCPFPGGIVGTLSFVIPVAEKFVVPGFVWSQRLDLGATCAEYLALTNHLSQDYTSVGSACKYGGWKLHFVDLVTFPSSTSTCDPIAFETTQPMHDCWIFSGPLAPCVSTHSFTITE